MILTNWRRIKSVVLPHYGQVGAGKVVDFLPRGKKTVVIPKTQKREGLATVTVCGDSLRDVGISNGDSLVCRVNIEKSELKNGKLIVAQLPCLGLVVKFFYEFDNKIVLRSANPRYEDLIFAKDLVEIKAIVTQSVKDWE
ncbi:MAG: LexA family protein [Pyrinomonadaceae bacterium]